MSPCAFSQAPTAPVEDPELVLDELVAPPVVPVLVAPPLELPVDAAALLFAVVPPPALLEAPRPPDVEPLDELPAVVDPTAPDEDETVWT